MIPGLGRRRIRAAGAPPTAPGLTGPGWTNYFQFESIPLGGVINSTSNGIFEFGQIEITNEQSLTGLRSMKFLGVAGSESFGGTFSTNNGGLWARRGDTIRVRVYFWMPDNFIPSQTNGNRIKFIRLTRRTNTDSAAGGSLDLHFNTNALTNANPYTYSVETTGPFWQAFGAGHPIVKETWECIEYAATLDSVSKNAGGLAEVRVWKNGFPVFHNTSAANLINATDQVRQVQLFSNWNEGLPQDQHLYCDNIISTTRTPTLLDVNGIPYLGTALFDPTV